MSKPKNSEHRTYADGEVSAIADALVANAADRTLAIGPVLWQPSDGTSARQWYFIVGSADAAKRFCVTPIWLEQADEKIAKAARLELDAELSTRRPVITHTFDDELEMMRFAEAQWPCEQSTKIRRALEAGIVNEGGQSK